MSLWGGRGTYPDTEILFQAHTHREVLLKESKSSGSRASQCKPEEREKSGERARAAAVYMPSGRADHSFAVAIKLEIPTR